MPMAKPKPLSWRRLVELHQRLEQRPRMQVSTLQSLLLCTTVATQLL